MRMGKKKLKSFHPFRFHHWIWIEMRDDYRFVEYSLGATAFSRFFLFWLFSSSFCCALIATVDSAIVLEAQYYIHVRRTGKHTVMVVADVCLYCVRVNISSSILYYFFIFFRRRNDAGRSRKWRKIKKMCNCDVRRSCTYSEMNLTEKTPYFT